MTNGKKPIEAFALSKVPREQRKSWIDMVMVQAGMVICIPAFLLGSMLAEGMPTLQAMVAGVIGYGMVLVLTLILGIQGADLGIPTGTISLAKAIGEVIQQARETRAAGGRVRDIYSALDVSGLVQAKCLCACSPLRAFGTDFKDGFDVGSYVIGEGEGRYKILFQNENLLLYQLEESGEERLLMTAPDIITLYNAQNGDPITNEDLFLHREAGDLDTLQVALGVIRVDQKWWREPENTEAAWRPYFDVLGYGDEVVRFSQLGVRN